MLERTGTTGPPVWHETKRTPLPDSARLPAVRGSARMANSQNRDFFAKGDAEPDDRITHCAEDGEERRDRRNPARKHAEQPQRSFCAVASGRSPHVHVRADRIRLRAHRKLPDVRVSGYFAAISALARLAHEPRDEFDRRGRPDYSKR